MQEIRERTGCRYFERRQANTGSGILALGFRDKILPWKGSELFADGIQLFRHRDHEGSMASANG
jgi:hypothetical protein